MPRDADSLKIRKWAGSEPMNSELPEDARLNRSEGWPQSYGQFASGDFPERKVFNRLLLEVTALWHEVNRRGILEWSSEITYRANALVVHGGSLWISLRVTSAELPGDAGGAWREMASRP